MALTPAEEQYMSARDDYQRTSADAEWIVSNPGKTDAERQAATTQLDGALQRMDSAWNAVQTERYGPAPEWTPGRKSGADHGRAR